MTDKQYVISLTEDELKDVVSGLGMIASTQDINDDEMDRVKEAMKRLFMIWAQGNGESKRTGQRLFEQRWDRFMEIREEQT